MAAGTIPAPVDLCVDTKAIPGSAHARRAIRFSGPVHGPLFGAVYRYEIRFVSARAPPCPLALGRASGSACQAPSASWRFASGCAHTFSTKTLEPIAAPFCAAKIGRAHV